MKCKAYILKKLAAYINLTPCIHTWFIKLKLKS